MGTPACRRPCRAGGEPSDAAAVRVDAPADLGVARADRLTGGGCHGVRLGKERTQAGRGVRGMSLGTRRRSDSGPPNGRRHGESGGTWRILRVRAGMPENDPREFPTPEAAFAVLVEEYADRKWSASTTSRACVAWRWRAAPTRSCSSARRSVSSACSSGRLLCISRVNS